MFKYCVLVIHDNSNLVRPNRHQHLYKGYQILSYNIWIIFGDKQKFRPEKIPIDFEISSFSGFQKVLRDDIKKICIIDIPTYL